MYIQVTDLSFGWDAPLIRDLNCRFEAGWTGITGVNGSGKTTLLNLLTGGLLPESGDIQVAGSLLYCRQVPEPFPAEAESLFDDYSAEAYQLKRLYGLEEVWRYRPETLSHGERKRIQVAAAIWLDPDILILDEPTNHLDSESKAVLTAALKQFRGVGIIVSHDRQLLDELTNRTLFLEPPGHDLREQPYSEAVKVRDEEAAWNASRRASLQKQIRRLEGQAAAYRRLARGADKRSSKRRLDPKDHDGRLKLDCARLLGKDAMHGKMLNQLQGRIRQEQEKADALLLTKRPTFDFALHFTPDRRRYQFMLEDGEIRMGDKLLTYPDLSLGSGDHTALTGVNGSGKSTLLKMIYPHCREEETLYIPQEIPAAGQDSFFRRVNSLPNHDRGELYAIMAALGSDPRRVLAAESPSPGELRKLLIADAIRGQIALMILDEPTNHLDLKSIEALESALSAYRAALLLVSHDAYFLQGTTDRRWEITEGEPDTYTLRIRS